MEKRYVFIGQVGALHTFEVTMKIKAGIAGLGLFAWALTAQAQTSAYSSMAVPGTHNDWSTTPTMKLVADYTWVCTQTFSSASGLFKFAANGAWTVNWGGSAILTRVPAQAYAPDPNGANISYEGFSSGPYRITFNESTKQFTVEWVGGPPPPPPTYTNIALVGDFNGWTWGQNMLSNSPAQPHLWTGTVDLEQPAGMKCVPDNNDLLAYGPAAATSLTPPVINAGACGKANFQLTGFLPGKFAVELNTSNATFSIHQVTTQDISMIAVEGNFMATNPTPRNMMRMGQSAVWESDHFITNNGAITLRFSANGGARRWGAASGAPAVPHPASGTLVADSTSFFQITGITTGRYRITFNHLTAEYSFRQLYKESAGVNLLKNPGFEQTTQGDNGGDAVDWGGWQAWPKKADDGYQPHSGKWCGAIHGRLFPEWSNYGSFAQDVTVQAGKIYRASAWFRATPNWSAQYMQIKIEWLDASSQQLGGDAICNIPSLDGNWTKYSAEGVAPPGAVRAHVVFLCSEAGTTGTMQIDDAEMRAVAGRTQNFDSWSGLTSYGPFSPDWSITSGKVVWNTPPGRPPAEVFISQYVEGTGNNKAIEIYNGTLSNLDLAAQNYVLQQYDNGSLTPSVSMPLSGTLQPGTCLVVARPPTPAGYAPDIAITSLNPLTNKYLTFNGDDVIVLRKGGASGTVVDRVGQVSTNATGSIWSRNTTDRTLTRKQNVWTGNVSAVTAPFPLDQWTLSPKDTFTGLGTHDISFLDPNEPYTPAGYSLIMNTNATLLSGDLPGGIGDVSFYWRTEVMSPPVTMVMETAPSESGPWLTNATLANVASSNFSYYVTSINRSDALYWRIRQTSGAPNRFRLDEITISEVSTIHRVENFETWTDPSYAIPGSYSRYGWSIQQATIDLSAGVAASRAARLSPPDSAVGSPDFEGGIGETLFWAKAVDAAQPAHLLLQTSMDKGSNWVTQGSFTVSTAATFSAWAYITNAGSRVRIIFDPNKDSGDVFVDNVEVRLPSVFRNQNFDSWPTRGTYGDSSHQGWSVVNSIVDSQNAMDGQVARLNTTTGNYIQSPYLPGGIGSLSFWTRKWSASDANFTLQVQVSPNGTSWTTITSIVANASYTTYQQASFFLGDASNHFVRLYHSAGAVRVLVDDIRIGAYQPRPQVLATAGLDPANPNMDEPMWVTGDVISRYGANILSVTGFYGIASSSWSQTPMETTGYGSYVAPNPIPGQPPGTMLRYYIQVRYAGIGAAPNSTTYTTNTYTSPTLTNYVSSVKKGTVWINEIFYAPCGDEWEEDSEFIELCGLAETDISGWAVQLAFGKDSDIAKNNGQPIYATYPIPAGAIFTNQTNGFSFYVIGDQELKNKGEPVKQVLNVFVPTNVAPWADQDRNHIHNGVGVIRLLNQFGNVVYSLVYGGYAAGSEPIPQTQKPYAETNSIGLTGSASSGFEWEKDAPTIGQPNVGQELAPPAPEEKEYAYAWHTQSLLITPINTNEVLPFYMFDPPNAGHIPALHIYYGFTNAHYPSAKGTLYHRKSGQSGWNQLVMSIRDASLDAEGHAYARGIIPGRTYQRLDTIEYVIAADPNKSGVLTSYLGSDAGGNNISTIYTNLLNAQDNPFTYRVPIADQIVITNVTLQTNRVILQTIGNDVPAPAGTPIVRFQVLSATNLLTDRPQWTTNRFTNSAADAYGGNIFYITNNPVVKPKLFYRVDPLWP